MMKYAEKLVTLLRKPYVPVVLIVCTGAVFSMVVFAVLRGREMDKIRAEFHGAAEDRASITRNEIEFNVLMLELLRAFHLGSREVERHEFAKFVQPCFSKVRRVQAMEWVARVPDAERTEYEAAARRDGFEDFQITEKDAHGRTVRASRRGEYFPVSFIEPFHGNEAAIGFDLASEPARREALD
ncbi:MAG: CHASE domain-containing protein, partial [Planctomycetes bacterium]|nr:CHASE domain-containing protein [Planctomycetota bacterium]